MSRWSVNQPNQPTLLRVAQSFAAVERELKDQRNPALGRRVSGGIRIHAIETQVNGEAMRGAQFSYETHRWDSTQRRRVRVVAPISMLLEDETYVALFNGRGFGTGAVTVFSKVYPTWTKTAKGVINIFVAPFERTPFRERQCSACRGTKLHASRWCSGDSQRPCYNCRYTLVDGKLLTGEPTGKIQIGGVYKSLVPLQWGLRVNRAGEVQPALIEEPVVSAWAGGITPEVKLRKELDKGIAELLKLDDFLSGV